MCALRMHWALSPVDSDEELTDEGRAAQSKGGAGGSPKVQLPGCPVLKLHREGPTGGRHTGKTPNALEGL